ncbi:hypothetical protein [Nostoc sp.]|uniref:hypothetical protein n=1 Tax=Nostoc sp. TaxID=1180 RepID=UPI002FF6DE43
MQKSNACGRLRQRTLDSHKGDHSISSTTKSDRLSTQTSRAIAFHNFPQLDIVKWLQQLHSYGLLSGSFRIVFYPIENCCKIY